MSDTLLNGGDAVSAKAVTLLGARNCVGVHDFDHPDTATGPLPDTAGPGHPVADAPPRRRAWALQQRVYPAGAASRHCKSSKNGIA